MSKILIATRPDDTHAIYVKLALETQGDVVDLWYTADYPTQLTYSFQLRHNKFDWHARGLDCEIQHHDYDIVWYRRPGKPFLPDYIHQADIANARRENNTFVQSLWQTIFPDAIWINPVNAATRAKSKLLQLKLAAEANLKVPDTIISNDPRLIQKYIKHHKNIIYKSLYPMAWLSKDELRLTYTNLIQLKDLPTNKLLQCTPGIFQEKITKNHELRVTYFNEDYVAVKIDSQAHKEALLDWRAAPTNELTLEQIALPDNINVACKQIMNNLGIIFGCFDFIVTPDNEYYFLEVNEQGQFLWIEETNPSIKMLQAFCKFTALISQQSDKDFSAITLRSFGKDASHLKAQAMKFHINPSPFN